MDAPDALRAALQRLGALASPPAVEEDLFFRHPVRDLVASDEALRLRRLASGPGGEGHGFELTHKGPRLAGPYKSRVERTVRTGDDPTALLEALGFAPSVRLRKTRQRFRLGAVEVTLDHVEGLGWFAEVEGPSGQDAAGSAAAVQAALNELGLADHPRVERSYVELALASGAPAAERA